MSVAACRLSLVAASGGHSLLLCTGFSLWWPLPPRSMGSRRTGLSSCGVWASVVAAHGPSSCGSQALERGLSSCGSRALEHRLSNRGAQAQLLHSPWDPPGPGLKPMSPVLAGGFLTTAPPGMPLNYYLIYRFSLLFFL